MSNPWIAGLGAGLSSLGEDLTRRKTRQEDAERTEAERKAASDRAMALLVKGKEIDNANENIYGPAYNIDIEENGQKKTVAVHDNKRTGKTELAEIAEPPKADPNAGMAALTGGPVPRTPLLRRPGMPMPSEAPPVASQAPVEPPEAVLGPPDPNDIPAPQAVTQDTTPRKRTLSVTPKATPVARRTPRSVMVDGVPAVVMIGADGSAVTEAGLPVSGKVTPYVPPVRPGAQGGVGGFGAGGIGGVGRTLAGIAGLHTAHESMKPYEDTIAAGRAKFDGLDYYKTLMGKMYDSKGIVDPAIHATAMANLGSTNPDLALYLQNAELWALEESMLSNRPSDFRTKLDAFVSTLKPNSSGAMIHGIQNSREVRLGGWDKATPALEAQLNRVSGTPAGGGRAAGGAPVATATPAVSEADWAKANPAKKGETFEAYHARYVASQRKP